MRPLTHHELEVLRQRYEQAYGDHWAQMLHQHAEQATGMAQSYGVESPVKRFPYPEGVGNRQYWNLVLKQFPQYNQADWGGHAKAIPPVALPLGGDVLHGPHRTYTNPGVFPDSANFLVDDTGDEDWGEWDLVPPPSGTHRRSAGSTAHQRQKNKPKNASKK